MRLLSRTIYAGIGIDRVIDLEQITTVEPDVVALQEVDRRTKRSKEIDIAAKLTELKW